MATKSNLGASVPKPANQGGHSSVNVQPAKIQAMPSVAKPGPSTIKYSAQPSGTKGTNKGAK
jgi:hypothetical protein